MPNIRQCVFIDHQAPWHHWKSTSQREAPGKGRYFVRAQFGGHRFDSATCEVEFWLPEKTGNLGHTFFRACCEITNSRRDPREFAGMELPSTPEQPEICDGCAEVARAGAS